MRTRIATGAGLLAAALLVADAYAQAPARSSECPKGASERVEGHVVKVDPDQGTLTIRSTDGLDHAFRASKETLQDMKVGDRIAAKLRVSENCKKS